MTIKRVRGDNYPIDAILKVNKVAVDLTGATVTFSYLKNGATSATSIVGSITDAVNGSVQFIPAGSDFIETGTYKYDIQRLQNGVTTTHLIGQLIIEDDVSKG